MEQEDSFIESFESLLDTLKRLVVKPVKRVTGFASLGFLLIVLLFLSLIFVFIGIIKIMQGLGLLLGVNPTGFAFASLVPGAFSAVRFAPAVRQVFPTGVQKKRPPICLWFLSEAAETSPGSRRGRYPKS